MVVTLTSFSQKWALSMSACEKVAAEEPPTKREAVQ